MLEIVFTLLQATALLSSIVFFALVIIGINSCRRPKNYPPGPKWVPFLGNTSYLKKISRKLGGQHHAFKFLGKFYNTNVLGLKLGNALYVVVKQENLIKQIYLNEEFQARPDNFFIRLRSMGTRKGITMTDGPFWQEQRTFALRHLRDFGFGKGVMEELILTEFEDLQKLLGNGGEIGWKRYLAPSVLNVLWALAAGSRFQHDDPRLKSLLTLMDKRSMAFDMAGGVLSQLPWLRHIAPDYSGFTLIQDLNKQLAKLLQDTINEHKQTFEKNKERDFIDVFLKEISQTNGNPTTFTEDQLIMVCLDFFIAGSMTTSNTLGFAFINMILHPEIQEKVQKEIDEVVGQKKFVTLADRKSLPYTEAVLLESQRFQHVVPIVGPRRVLQDTKIENYDIPAGSTVLMNLYEFHHDPERWGDPENFRPERFIDKKGEFCPDELYLFSVGKRRCLGEALARNFLFLFFAGLLRLFKMSPVPGKPLPTIDPLPGITLSPKPFTCIISLRNKKK